MLLLLTNQRRNSILMTRYYPDLVRASDWLKICLNQSEELPRSQPVPGSQIVGKRQRKRCAKSWRGGKKEKGRERAPALPSLLPFYFRVCAFSIQRTRLSRSLEQATQIRVVTRPQYGISALLYQQQQLRRYFKRWRREMSEVYSG